MATTAKNCSTSIMKGQGVVSKTVDTKMLQTVKNNDVLFGKVVAHDQLFHLVILKINHVAMVTISKTPKWQPLTQVLEFV